MIIYLFISNRKKVEKREVGEREAELPEGAVAADVVAYGGQKRNERWPRLPGIVYQGLRCK